MIKASIVALAGLLGLASAQDPPEGWLGYASGLPPKGVNRLTYAEAYWKNLGLPATAPNSAFYSPWFGFDPLDNLNLIQPVNPWLGNGWVGYTEYYQWDNGYNSNSNSFNTNPGDLIYGNVTFLGEDQQAYLICQTDLTTSQSSCQTVQVEQNSDGSYKNYSISYWVFEKVANCQDYPPDNKVTFYNITLEYDGKDVTDSMSWTTSYVDDVCNNRAHIVNSRTIEITWDSSADAPNNPSKEMIEARSKVGLQRTAGSSRTTTRTKGASAALRGAQ